jgi:hypothetical protein
VIHAAVSTTLAAAPHVLELSEHGGGSGTGSNATLSRLKVFTNASAMPFDSGEYGGVVQTTKSSERPNATVAVAV